MKIRCFSRIGLISAFIAGCGGGGTLAIDLTDAPPDLAALDHVYVSLAAVEVHVATMADTRDGDPADTSIDQDDRWRVIVDRAGTFDLLALQNDVTSPIGEIEAPVGKITQIRLHIDAEGDNKVVLPGGEECPLDLGAVEGTGIKINHPFKAIGLPEEDRLRVVVDFDLKESIDQTDACGFKLNPVIKIKKVDTE